MWLCLSPARYLLGGSRYLTVPADCPNCGFQPRLGQRKQAGQDALEKFRVVKRPDPADRDRLAGRPERKSGLASGLFIPRRGKGVSRVFVLVHAVTLAGRK